MNRLYSRAGAFALTSALCLVTVGRLSAQATAAPAATKPAEEETIVLSPFVVEASEDQGYTAKDTLAGTRVRTELKDVASAISVVTQQFLKDTGAKNSADLLVYTPSTEVSGIRGNFSGAAGTAIYQENTVSNTTRVRGLDQADNTRDYFLTDIPWDGFNVGRVDLQRGPNSILFGTGSPAGIINTSVNDASFKTAYNVEDRFDQYGSVRNSVNLNQELVKGVLAVRFAMVKDDQKFEQVPAYNNSTRTYGALRFDPKLFGEENHTSIRLKYEDGKISSNNPRSLPPVDEITPWFKVGNDAYGNPGFNKLVINQFSLTNKGPNGLLYPGGSGGTLSNATFQLGGWAQTRSYWPDVINYYEAVPINQNQYVNAIGNLANANQPGGTPIQTIAAQINTGNSIYPDSGGNRVTAAGGFRPYGIPSMSQIAANIGYAGTSGVSPAYPQGVIPGGAYYADNVITDPTIFNFYKKLADGPNKHEYSNWQAFNGAIEQSFFNDRLAVQVALDHQVYSEGALRWMTGSNYAIAIDPNVTYADGTLNPNVGRPYFGDATSAPSLNYNQKTVRNTWRVTPTYEFRTEDLLGNTDLAKILGKHRITGLWEEFNLVKDNNNFAEYATTPDYIIQNNTATIANNTFTSANLLASNRSYEWIVYVGPSLATRSSASGAHLTNIPYVVAPPKFQSTWNFNSTWNKPTNPSTPGYVDPTAPFTFTDTQGNVTNTVQSNNPANFVGWTKQPIQWMFASNPTDFPSLVINADRNRYRDISKGFTYQGYFLDGDLVPAFGWRKDIITNYQTNAITDQYSGFTSLNFADNKQSRTDVTGISRSWGGVYHLPKSLISKLPGEMTVSVFYNKSENFKADASRLNFYGNSIPNASGKTTEYGITVTALNDKLSLKVDWFKTKVANATLADTEGNSIAGLGNNAYFIADGAIWGYGWATALQDGLQGRTPGSSYWDYATADGFSRGSAAQNAAADAYDLNGGVSPNGNHFIGGAAIVAAWVNAAKPGGVLTGNYFASYNLTPQIIPTLGSASGNLRDSYPQGANDGSGPNTGGGSNFGNHQVTVDNLSKGVEIELSAQPAKNWNVTLNYTHVNATHDNIDSNAQKFIGDMTAFMNGPGGQVREWYNGGGTLGAQWNSSVVAPFTVELNSLGHAAPEVSPWRLNAITTYNFDRGVAKGVFVGGALRMEAGRIIGYHFDPNFKNIDASDPRYAAVPGLTSGGLNVNQPFIGSNDTHLDMWVGYSKKLTHSINWRIQLNLKSVGEKDRLVTSRIQPDGSIALARIVQGMGWQLTNSFDF